jgi:hypothetical protein
VTDLGALAIEAKALYLLSHDGISEEARAKAVEKAQKGEVITLKEAERMIAAEVAKRLEEREEEAVRQIAEAKEQHQRRLERIEEQYGDRLERAKEKSEAPVM